MPYKVMVARFPGNLSEMPTSSGWVMKTALEMARDERISEIVPYWESDTPITMVRNRAVKAALELQCDYLLMIDSDMAPDCEPDGRPFWSTAWNFLMNRREQEEAFRLGHASEDHEILERAIRDEFPPATIAAPYCGPAPNELVYVFRWKSKESHSADLGFKLEMIDRDDAARRGGIESVAALPTGLILYDTRVFRILPPPWFEYEYADPPFNTTKATTEDVYQTRNASLLGLPQFCAWDCWAGHNKNKRVRKPRPVTSDIVSDAIARAISSGRTGREQLVFMHGGVIDDKNGRVC